MKYFGNGYILRTPRRDREGGGRVEELQGDPVRRRCTMTRAMLQKGWGASQATHPISWCKVTYTHTLKRTHLHVANTSFSVICLPLRFSAVLTALSRVVLVDLLSGGGEWMRVCVCVFVWRRCVRKCVHKCECLFLSKCEFPNTSVGFSAFRMHMHHYDIRKHYPGRWLPTSWTRSTLWIRHTSLQ